MITVIADDLSGAAEAAEQFRLRGHDVVVRLAPDPSGAAARGGVTVVDTDSRTLSADAAALAVAACVPAHGPADAGLGRGGAGVAGLVVKKIDSLWRGNVASEIRGLQDAGFRIVVAGALPALGRTVIGGAPFAAGVALHESEHWALEPRPAPRTVAEALGAAPLRAGPSHFCGPSPVGGSASVGGSAQPSAGLRGPAGRDRNPPTAAHVGLAAVRGGDLAAALRSALAAAPIAVVDGETDADVAAVVAAFEHVPTADVALVGTAALAAAVAARFAPEPEAVGGSRAPTAGRRAPAHGDEHPPTSSAEPTAHALVVVGTGAGAATGQLESLRAAGVAVVTFDPRRGEDRDGDVLASLTAALAAGATAALALVSPERVEPRDAVRRLGWIAAESARRDPELDLVLTGGETARRVLDLLAVDALRPLGQVEHGAVVSRAGDGRLVATKPGSFGGPDVLTALLHSFDTLRGSRTDFLTLPHPPGDTMDTSAPSTTSATSTATDSALVDSDARPFIAVTMGDGAGVGPEVTVGALLDEAAYRDARPIVIGDTRRLRMGAAALGVEADVVEITDVDQAEFTPGRINVIDPHLLSPDLPWGKVSAEAGNAAYHYIRIACELGMAGKVQGICTAPLNKAALHEAGHVFPGHTELLAHFMGVGEVSMMLSTPKIKVIHVTTHIGLIDAIAKIEPGLVERTVRRGWEALRRAGVEDPTIGVCAINPHAGENGLFGYGEEAEKITPAIEILQAEGMRVAGPLPADTAFFLGGRGDYDLIVAMYHDQGHGPVKVLGIEAGVNITVGLPVIRTSVDHGTAFDIAGTGKVAVGSMIEALRQAVEMSPSPLEARATSDAAAPDAAAPASAPPAPAAPVPA